MSNTNKKNKDGKVFSKLKLVQDYNKNMGGVYWNDALVGNYTSIRKSLKWTTKVAFHFIEEAVSNAFVLFNKANPGKIRFMHFKLNIIKSIISRSQPSAPSYNLPLVGRHFLQLIPPTAAKSNPQKNVLWKRSSERVPLPMEELFRSSGSMSSTMFWRVLQRIKTWYRKYRAEAAIQRCSYEKVEHLFIRTSRFLWKGILINMQQNYKITPMLKCDFNKAA